MYLLESKNKEGLGFFVTLPSSKMLLRKMPAAGTATAIALIMKLDKAPSAQGNLGLFEKLEY